jgi:hypothetical protein
MEDTNALFGEVPLLVLLGGSDYCKVEWFLQFEV